MAVDLECYLEPNMQDIIRIESKAETNTDRIESLEDGTIRLGTLDSVENEYVQITGIFSAYSGWKRTGYVAVRSTTIRFNNVTKDSSRFNAFYDEDKNFISNFTLVAGSNTINVPSDAKYYAVSAPKANFDDIIIDNPALSDKYSNSDKSEYISIREYGSVEDSYVTKEGDIKPYSGWDTRVEPRTYKQWTRSVFIPVDATSIKFKGSTLASAFNVFFDKNMKPLSSFTISTGRSTISVPENAKYMCISNATDNYFDLELTRPSSLVEDNSDVYNNRALYDDKIMNAISSFGLCCITDIHGDHSNIKRMLEYMGNYNFYLSDYYHLGDSAAAYYEDENPFSVCGSNVLNVVGNHDVWGKTSGAHTISATDAYNKFFKDYISDWNVTHSGTVCYYYKDYSTPKIRVIVLDSNTYETDSTQKSWFATTLASAKTAGYAVICMAHYQPEKGIKAFACNFASNVAYSYEGGRLADDAYVKVDSFITSGGEFICWMGGHTHYDEFGTVNGHPDQINLTLENSGTNGTYNDGKRIFGTKSQDCISVIGVDRTKKILNVVRIGTNSDYWMRDKVSICIDYKSKTIVDKLDSAVGTLNGEVSQLKNDLALIMDKEDGINLYNKNDTNILNNKYMNTNGVVEDLSGRMVTGYIDVSKYIGNRLIVSRLNGSVREEAVPSSVTCFNSSKTVIESAGQYNPSNYTIQSGTSFVRITIANTFTDVMVECNSDGTIHSYEEYGCTVKFTDSIETMYGLGELGNIENRISNIEDSYLFDVLTLAKSKNLYVSSEENKYLNADGTIEDYNNRCVTDYIPVTVGKVVTLSSGTESQRNKDAYSSCVLYDSDKNVVSGDYNKYNVTIPSGVSYIRLTVPSTFIQFNPQIELTENGAPTSYEAHHDIMKLDRDVITHHNMGKMIIKGSLASGETLSLPIHNVKNHNIITFYGNNITSFSKLKIGKETDAYVEIDGTNVIIHNDVSSKTMPHGLTISKNISVTIENETSYELSKIRIMSNGNEYVYDTPYRFIMDMNRPYVISDGTVITDCTLSWTSRHINKPIWLFGDSYFSWYDNRWVYYLAREGYTESCMLNGYAGEDTTNALVALKNLLSVKVPDYVVWCQGMNNTDSTTAVNATWKNGFDEVIKLSSLYGFVPIFATIPCTPTMQNKYKNAIIRNSGYRYIEFADTVNVSRDSSTWIEGTCADNVHPTALGAKMLFYRAISDLPELTSK